MEAQPDAGSRQCDVRECLAVYRNSFTLPLAAIVDPRVPRIIPYDGAALAKTLRELANEVATQPAPTALCLVVFELDDPGRRLLRFEIPGTLLGFTIPFSPDAPVPADPADVPAQPLAILVAEDNPTNQQLAVECLHALGSECQIAADGTAAVEAARQRRYDVIFMDIHMPHMDGLTATRAIRCLPEGAHPYIAALTAYAMPGDKTRAFEAGMDDYITKPCRLDNLAAVLKKARARKF